MKRSTLFCLFFVVVILAAILIVPGEAKKNKNKEKEKDKEKEKKTKSKSSTASATPASTEDSEDDAATPNVLEFDTTKFDEVIPTSEYVLVEFYAPWCGHCQRLEPEYERAANILKSQNSPVILAKINGEAERILMERFQINGFPTLMFFRKGKAGITYSGPRTSDAIVSWVTKKSGLPATVLRSDKELADFIEAEEQKLVNSAIVIGSFSEDTDGFAKFLESAESPRIEDLRFGLRLFPSSDARAGTIELKRSFDKDITMEVTDETTVEDLVLFFLGNGYPYLEPADVSWNRLRDTGNPIGLVIYDAEAESAAAVHQAVVRAAKLFVGRIGFASVGAEYIERAKDLGVSGNRIPTVVIMHPLGANYPFPDDLELVASKDAETNDLVEWLKKVYAGEIKPHFKSKPIPTAEENQGPVKIVVGHSFNDTVLDEEKNVLIELYAPWCGHCKNLEPIYEEVGKYFAESQEYADVVVAKMDAASNDNEIVRIAGYPTIFLFKRGEKDKPLEFRGQRTKEDLISFVLRSTGRAAAESTPPAAPQHDEHDEL